VKIRPQHVKWIVYGLLLFDFVLYFIEDVESARFTINERSSWLDYTSAYVTSIDLAAWFTLILLFEIETRRPLGQEGSRAAKWTVRGIRLFCCTAILHTSFSYDITLREFQNPKALPAAADVCVYQGGDWSFLRNREYLVIDAASCGDLGRGPEFFDVGNGGVITDRAGLREGTVLAWTDLVESVSWLIVVALTELAVRLQRAGRSAMLRATERSVFGVYALILVIALYWGSKQQYLYLWDEVIWVCGFLVIDWNIRRGERGWSRPERTQPAAV
jgi:hypothetical protein